MVELQRKPRQRVIEAASVSDPSIASTRCVSLGNGKRNDKQKIKWEIHAGNWERGRERETHIQQEHTFEVTGERLDV